MELPKTLSQKISSWLWNIITDYGKYARTNLNHVAVTRQYSNHDLQITNLFPEFYRSLLNEKLVRFQKIVQVRNSIKVENKIGVEIKICRTYLHVHFKQVNTFLSLMNLKHGTLLNLKVDQWKNASIEFLIILAMNDTNYFNLLILLMFLSGSMEISFIFFNSFIF